MIFFLKPVIPILGFSRETEPQEFAYVIKGGWEVSQVALKQEEPEKLVV